MKKHLLCLIAAGITAGARAQDIDGRWGVGGALGYGDYLSPGSLTRATDPDIALGGRLRKGIAPGTEAVLALDALAGAGKDPASGVRLRALTLGLLQPLGRPEDSFFYGTLAGGAAFTRGLNAARDRVQPTLKAGLGWEHLLTAKTALGLQVDYHRVLPAGRFAREASALALTLTYTSFFYCDRTAPRAPLRAAAPAAPAAIRPPDADGDGVPDMRDSCPGTPEGETVDAFGCPQDSDGDGVTDILDACPNTPAGTLVNTAGCPAEKVEVTLDIKFDGGQADVKPEFDAALKKVADFMARFPAVTAVIEGHTDNRGTPANNQALSQKRADAVRRALVERFQVPAARVTARGYGDTQPLANNATPQGRAANRRVVATLSAIPK